MGTASAAMQTSDSSRTELSLILYLRDLWSQSSANPTCRSANRKIRAVLIELCRKVEKSNAGCLWSSCAGWFQGFPTSLMGEICVYAFLTMTDVDLNLSSALFTQFSFSKQQSSTLNVHLVSLVSFNSICSVACALCPYFASC